MSGKRLYRDSDGYVNRKESEITAYLVSKSLTKEQWLPLIIYTTTNLISLKALSPTGITSSGQSRLLIL